MRSGSRERERERERAGGCEAVKRVLLFYGGVKRRTGKARCEEQTYVTYFTAGGCGMVRGAAPLERPLLSRL